jgi:hypothetical protein
LWTQYAYSYTRYDQKYMIENESIRWCVPKRVQLQMAYLALKKRVDVSLIPE